MTETATNPRRAALLLDMEQHSDFGLFQREQITDRAISVLDGADPLRVLLADRERFVEFAARSVASGGAADMAAGRIAGRSMWAALREVADGG